MLCLHGFTRAGVASAPLHAALWGRLASAKWQQLAPKQLTLALWSAAMAKQQPGTLCIASVPQHTRMCNNSCVAKWSPAQQRNAPQTQPCFKTWPRT